MTFRSSTKWTGFLIPTRSPMDLFNAFWENGSRKKKKQLPMNMPGWISCRVTAWGIRTKEIPKAGEDTFQIFKQSFGGISVPSYLPNGMLGSVLIMGILKYSIS